MLRVRWLLLCASFLLLSQPVAAWAQQSSPAVKAEFDSVYQQLLRKPSDPTLNRRLIQAALEMKDYDAAIGAIERLIFYDPSNPALQLEAARLYLQINSYAAAAGYLQEALNLAGTTIAQRDEASALLADIDRKTKPSIWGAFVQVGARSQTNANVGSRELGLNEPLPFEKPVADWNSFALGTLGLTNPLSQNIVIEAALSGYYADQARINRLDLGFAETNAGVRFVTDDGAISFKPYALAQGILLGGSSYQRALGGGAQLRWTIADGLWVEPGFEYKNRVYYVSENYPLATDQNGNIFAYIASGKAQITEDFGLSTRVALNDNRAVSGYQSYLQYTGTLSLQMRFDVFDWKDWMISPFASVLTSKYSGIAPPEEFAGFDTVRKDLQWSVGANLEVPVVGDFGIGAQVEYTRNKSNLDRFVYENFQVSFGPQARF